MSLNHQKFIVQKSYPIFFVANTPNLNFETGLLIGKSNIFHHGICHSFGAGLFVSFITVILIVRKGNNYKRHFQIVFDLYCSHLF